MKDKTIFQLSKRSLHRLLGSLDLFAIGYGDVGSSIYYALGAVAVFSLGMTPISIMLAGFVFICTALTYAELASTFPESGGSATFSRRAFNDLISFIAGWGLLLDYIVTIAISAFAIPPYLASVLDFFGLDVSGQKGMQMIASIVFILILFGLNVRGVKESTRFSLILAIFTIFTQLVIIVLAGFLLLNVREVFAGMHIGKAPTWGEFMKGTAMAMVAYTGIESIAQLSGETKNPGKMVPRAIFLTIFTLVILYIGISFAALSSVTPQELGTKYIDNPVLAITNSLPGGLWLSPWVGLIAAMILFIASNAGLIGASRLSYSLGEYYQVPRFFYRLHPRYKTPYIALAFFAALAILVIVGSRGKLLFLADLYNFGAMLAFLSTHLSLIIMRIKEPDIPRPFRVPFNIRFGKVSIPITAIIGALATFSVWILVIVTKPDGRIAGFLWLFFGVIMYIFYRRRQKIRALGSVNIEKVSIPSFKTIDFQKILVPTRGGRSTETVQIACQTAKNYKAEVIAVHIIEVPYSAPFEAPFPKKTRSAQAALKRADAIAREYRVPIKHLMIRARSVPDAIYDLVKDEKCDLVIIGGSEKKDVGISRHIEEILTRIEARVWICAPKK